MKKATKGPGRCHECDTPMDDATRVLCIICDGRAHARRHGHLALRQGAAYECCLCDASGSIESGALHGNVFTAECPNRLVGTT